MDIASAEAQSVEMDITCAREQAAKRIQALARGFLLRKSLPAPTRFRIEYGKLVRATSHIAAGKLMQRLDCIEHTEAADGNTPVWFPTAYPGIIMKFSGRFSHSRLEVMEIIREVLETQGSSHAIVPIAREHKGMLVEERLPVNVDNYYNMWLYLHNRKAFDSVVRELVRLYSESGGLSDLIGVFRHPLSQLGDFGVRFDNLPFYLNKQGEGCVGLVDLERMGWCSFLSGCVELARIFPFHVDLILDEAEKCNRHLDPHLLELQAEKGQKALKEGIQRYEEWLWKKEETAPESIDIVNPMAVLPRSRKEELIALVKDKLLGRRELSESNNLYEFTYTPLTQMYPADQPPLSVYNPFDEGVDVEWMRHPELTLFHQEISVDTLATGITLFVLQYFENALPKEGRAPSFKNCKKGREWEVIKDRSPVIKNGELLMVIGDMISAHQQCIKRKFFIPEGWDFPHTVTGEIVDTIMKDLISHEEIFSCDAIIGEAYWFRY